MVKSIFNIRRLSVNKADIEELQQLGIKTFSETFAKLNSKENMANYLAFNFNFEKLEKEISNPESEFYFAEDAGKVVGYLKINFGKAQTEPQNTNALEVERIYVLQDYHGEQVGKILFEKAVEIAKNKKIEVLWLGVWEKNTRAIRFYEKNGFIQFSKHVFKLGDDPQTDLMMRLKI